MGYGIALDIGTTTVSGSLLDLEQRIVITRFSALNSQLSYGHDIVSRLAYAIHKPNGPQRLQKSIASSINFILEKLIEQSSLTIPKIDLILAVGNPVMQHFLFSLPVTPFTKPPYGPDKTGPLEARAGKLGIKKFPDAKLKMLPNIAGFVGSDAIAVMLATGLHKSKKCIMAVDIGTNGEIMIGSKDGIVVTSTAAGSAFEGWHIGAGMRAVEGAIESAEEIDGKIKLGVIGNAEPQGISGSGLIDIISILLRKGEIDRAGRLSKKKFVVSSSPKRIVITQKDIREVQLAKAAISVGIKFLRERSACNIETLYVTGTFGNYINKDNARLLGLVPDDIDPDKIKFFKDGALTGAEKALFGRGLSKEIQGILAKTEHISLAEDKNFQSEFASAMYFLTCNIV